MGDFHFYQNSFEHVFYNTVYVCQFPKNLYCQLAQVEPLISGRFSMFEGQGWK